MKRSLTVSLLFTIFLFACKSGEQLPNYGVDTTMEGIRGQILWVEGNQMPSTDINTNSPKPKGVQKELYVFNLTNESQADRTASIYKNIQTQLVRKIMTGLDGTFVLALEPGVYSVFVSEENGYFANNTDSEGNINPIKVEVGKFTPVTIKIDYKAIY
ncbi:MAG: carboxypeptidase regulatory-like domain-containing protein [Bacteroidota bacterium]